MILREMERMNLTIWGTGTAQSRMLWVCDDWGVGGAAAEEEEETMESDDDEEWDEWALESEDIALDSEDDEESEERIIDSRNKVLESDELWVLFEGIQELSHVVGIDS